MSEDWFRRKTWTEADQQEFHARLNRSRGQSSKAQYLRIQAVELVEVGTEQATRAAIGLLELLLAKYPEQSEIAGACLCMGECCEALGQLDEAISWYRKALEQQRIFPNLQTNAQLYFAMLVAEEQKRDKYDEAISFLGEWSSLDDFPVMVFQECCARALIHFDKEEKTQAREWARRALEAAEKTHSGYRYHPRLGLVGEKSEGLVKRMQSIINPAEA
jgi:tetratricopeptide (TPR) repeat protein